MIVDTSALVAVIRRENGNETLLSALLDEPAFLPAPARIEFIRVAVGDRLNLAAKAEGLLELLHRSGMTTVPFDAEHARIACDANAVYGKGNGKGGTLNLLDLMIYAVAKQRDEPLLCTGADFAATDVAIHPASRIG